MIATKHPNPCVGLFVTCAVDLIRPSVAHACVELLEAAQCTVIVPQQSCCGQIGFNNGLPQQTRKLARTHLAAFAEVDYIVVPSGSCASMLKNHYPRLFKQPHDIAKAQAFADKVYEITCFLDEVLQVQPKPIACDKTVVYHDSCAGLRELGIKEQPRHLAQRYRQCSVKTMPNSDTCCGFGGTFCVKFQQISQHITQKKSQHLHQLQTDILVGGDISCLLKIAENVADKTQKPLHVQHIAEFLANYPPDATGAGNAE